MDTSTQEEAPPMEAPQEEPTPPEERRCSALPTKQTSRAGEGDKIVEEKKSEVTAVKSDVEAKPQSERRTSMRKSIASTKSFESKEKAKAASAHKTASADRPTTEPRISKDVISLQDSKKSILSLGPRGSRDASRDLFTRRKSSRSIGRAVGSIISFRRGSIAEYFDRQKAAKFMNTFKLESEKPFNVDKVEKILKEVLIEALDNLTYDTDKVPKQAKWASSMIRAKVKEQEFDRYKLICNVTIGEKRSQDMFATYRFLWDADRDKHASYIHENMYVFAIAVCFGIYYE